MRIASSTVHVYVKSIYAKFGVRSRPQLLARFLADVEI